MVWKLLQEVSFLRQILIFVGFSFLNRSHPCIPSEKKTFSWSGYACSMLRRFPFYPPQYTGSLAASSHVSSLAPTLIPLYKPTPLDYLNYPLRYETLFFFLSWQMQWVSKTPSNPLWNCHQFTRSFIKLPKFVFEWRPQMVYHFQNVSWNSVGKINVESSFRLLRPLFGYT